jgi:hypothetical protein
MVDSGFRARRGRLGGQGRPPHPCSERHERDFAITQGHLFSSLRKSPILQEVVSPGHGSLNKAKDNKEIPKPAHARGSA